MKFEAYSSSAPATNGGWPYVADPPFGGWGGCSIPYTTQHACESAAPPSARLAAPDSEADENISASEQLTIMVYPNPTTGILNVVLSLEENDVGVVEIRNYLGERLTEMQLQSGNNKVELGAFPSGLYFYSVLINDELVLQGKQVLLK